MRKQYLSNLPPKLEEGEKMYLVMKLRSGQATISDKHKLINGHLRLIVLIANQTAERKNSRDAEDILGEALLALTKAVNDAQHVLYDDNITGYIITTVKYRCEDYVRTNHVASMPARTIRYKLSHEQSESKELAESGLEPEKRELIRLIDVDRQVEFIEKASKLSIGELEQTIKSTVFEGLPIPKRVKMLEDIPRGDVLPGSYMVPIVHPDKMYELVELVEKSISTIAEKRIIALRMEGYTYEEIAKQTGISRPMVGVMMGKIEEQFDKYYVKHRRKKR